LIYASVGKAEPPAAGVTIPHKAPELLGGAQAEHCPVGKHFVLSPHVKPEAAGLVVSAYYYY